MPEQPVKPGLLLVISGPSGSGKGTVLKELFDRNINLFYSVSATTRNPRPGETEGVNYYFLTKEEFLRQAEKGNMLEYAEYCGNFYGTPKSAVDEMRHKGRDVVLEIEVQGARKVMASCPDAVSIFIMPPSEAELAKRLRGRQTEPEEVIEKRLSTALEEMKTATDYDYVVVNDIVPVAADKINAIITAEKCRSK